MSFLASVLRQVQTPKFWAAFLLGQFLSICITTTNVTTRLMSEKEGLNIPTTQSSFNYILLAFVYTSFTLYKYGLSKYLSAIKQRGLFYLCLAFVDVEANYFIVKGFATTSYLSAMLINACSTPSVVLLSFIFLKTRYQWSHLLGVGFAVVGLVMLVLSDILAMGGDTSANNPLLGDLFCIIAAVLYAVSNTMEEFFVRKHPTYEILGFLGLFGTIFNLLQMAILERDELKGVVWNSNSIGYYAGFTIAMFSLYSLVPVLIGLTNATFYNISLLTADFYGLIFGLFLFKSPTHPLYPFAFILVVLGLVIYNLRPAVSKFTQVSDSNPEENDLTRSPDVSSPKKLPSP